MNEQAIAAVIRDIKLPGRLVEVDRRVIRMDVLDDRTEKLHRVDLSYSEFCDLVLDWRERQLARAKQPAAAAVPAARRSA